MPRDQQVRRVTMLAELTLNFEKIGLLLYNKCREEFENRHRSQMISLRHFLVLPMPHCNECTCAKIPK